MLAIQVVAYVKHAVICNKLFYYVREGTVLLLYNSARKV